MEPVRIGVIGAVPNKWLEVSWAANTPIPTNDVWIAATALETGSRMLSFHSHFRQVPGLMMVL
jgi:predicted nucleic acid-binding protein